MGMSISYRSSEAIDPRRRDEIQQLADSLIEDHSWLSCEPISFYDSHDDGRLVGSSKPTLIPNDVAELEADDLPDGTLIDAMNVLCQLSEKFGIDWELSHDYAETPIGYIRQGHLDPDLKNQLMALTQIGELMSGSLDELSDFGPDDTQAPLSRSDDDHDEPPAIIKFPG